MMVFGGVMCVLVLGILVCLWVKGFLVLGLRLFVWCVVYCWYIIVYGEIYGVVINGLDLNGLSGCFCIDYDDFYVDKVEGDF